MVAIIPAALLAFGLATTYACPHGHQGHFKKHTIKAKGIEASFIEHGATLTVWINAFRIKRFIHHFIVS